MKRTTGVLACAIAMSIAAVDAAVLRSSAAAAEPTPAELVLADPIPELRAGGVIGLNTALRQKPVIYHNGCHQWRPNRSPVACEYGRTQNPRGTVMLFGDSHAAHWFDTLRAASTRAGWRMLSVTKSSCPADDLSVRRYRQTQPYWECNEWRQKVFRKLNSGGFGKVDAVIMSSWDFHQVLNSRKRVLHGQARIKAWQAGTESTLRQLTKSVETVYVLRDSPQLPGGTFGFQQCIRRNQTRPAKCGTTAKRALPAHIWRAETRAAQKYKEQGARTVDWSTELCPRNFCNPVINRRLVMQDDNHFTQTFARARWTSRLAKLLSDTPPDAAKPDPAPNPPVPKEG